MSRPYTIVGTNAIYQESRGAMRPFEAEPLSPELRTLIESSERGTEIDVECYWDADRHLFVWRPCRPY